MNYYWFVIPFAILLVTNSINLIYAEDSQVKHVLQNFINSSEGKNIIIVVGKNAGEPDLVAAQDLQNYISKLSPHTNISIQTDTALQDAIKTTSNIIVIGGPNANRISSELEPYLSLKILKGPFIPNPNPSKEKLNPSTSTFQFFNVENGIIYGTPLTQNYELSLIQLVTHPINDNDFLVVYGIEAKGTVNGINYLLDESEHFSNVEGDLVILNEIGGNIKVIDPQNYVSDKNFQASYEPLKITKQFKDNQISFRLGEPFTTIISVTNPIEKEIDLEIYDLSPVGMNINKNSLSCNGHVQTDQSILCKETIFPHETIQIQYQGKVEESSELGNRIVQGVQLRYTYNGIDYLTQSNELLVRITSMGNVFSTLSLDSNVLRSGESTNLTIEIENLESDWIYVNSTLIPPSGFGVSPNPFDEIYPDGNNLLIKTPLTLDSAKTYRMGITAPDYYFGIVPLEYEIILNTNFVISQYEENLNTPYLHKISSKKEVIFVEPMLIFSTETIMSLTIPPILGMIGLYVWKRIRKNTD